MIAESYINTEPTSLKELLQQGRNKLRAAEQMAEIKKHDDDAREAKERREAWGAIVTAARLALPEYLHLFVQVLDFDTRPAAYDAKIALEVPGCVTIRIKLMKSDTGSGPFWELEEKPYVVPYVIMPIDDDDRQSAETCWYVSSRISSVIVTDQLAVALALAEQRARELKAAQVKVDEYNGEEARNARELARPKAVAPKPLAKAELLFNLIQSIADDCAHNAISDSPIIDRIISRS